MNKKLILLISILALGLLTGCAGLYGTPTPESAPTPSAREGTAIPGVSANEISMVSGNLFFNPKNLTLVKDEPVKITFQNTGRHTFTVDELGVNVSLSGSSLTVEFTPAKSGAFEYYCSVPGHREGGMLGSLTVE